MSDKDPAVLKMEANIAEKTGRSVPEWVKVVQTSGLQKHGEIVKLLKTDHGFGGDVEVAPKKTYVSLRRKKQFALVQPSTKTRVDLGINLKGKPPAGRLEASGSFNAMVSHRVRLESASDVDAEVNGWLKEAYDAAG